MNPTCAVIIGVTAHWSASAVLLNSNSFYICFEWTASQWTPVNTTTHYITHRHGVYDCIDCEVGVVYRLLTSTHPLWQSLHLWITTYLRQRIHWSINTMFGKKQQIDYKKSLQKFLDIKRDSFNRLRHLRIILGVYSYDMDQFMDTDHMAPTDHHW